MNKNDQKNSRKQLYWIIFAATLVNLAICILTLNGNGDTRNVKAAGVSVAIAGAENTSDDSQQTEGEQNNVSSVSTYEELVAAIEQADADTIIGINCPITCPDGTALGNSDRSVILLRTSAVGRLIFSGSNYCGFVQNITFDGNNILADSPFVNAGFASLTLKNCKLINCVGTTAAAIGTVSGRLSLIDCSFDNNIADFGAHLRVTGKGATIENCTFTNGHARYKGGAIFCSGNEGIVLSGCTITGNSADLYGGGIYRDSGNLSITQSKIHGNTAGTEMDDIALSRAIYLPEFDDYQDVINLYEADGLLPNDWETREFYEDWMPDPGLAYYRTFREKTPQPSAVILNNSELTLNIGESDTLIAAIQPEGADGNVTWSSSDRTIATVDDSGLVTALSSGTVSITAAAGNVSAVCLVTILPNVYNIVAEPNSAQAGTVSGSGDYEDGSTVTVTAASKDGYRFIGWTENNVQVSTDESYTFAINRNRKLIAVFEAIPVYNVAISATQGGSANGGGNFEEGSTITIRAIPNDGFRFSGWTENGISVSSNADYTFTVNSNRKLTAVFELIPKPVYTVNVSATSGGTAIGGGTYEIGNTVTLSATPDDGYYFLNWTENDTVISSETVLTFTADSNRTLTAHFALIPVPVYTISVSAEHGGTVSGTGNYDKGASVTVYATPDEGYKFLYWAENGVPVSADAAYSFIATCDRTLKAIFEIIPISDPKPVYDIQVTATQGGTVNGGGSFTEGDTVTIEAKPDNGYRFLYWTENNQPVCTDTLYSFSAEGNRMLTAVFEVIPIPTYSISVTAATGGTATGSGTYEQGATVTITATPDNGYRFVAWQENGTTVSDVQSLSFTANADRTLTAVFEPVIPNIPQDQPGEATTEGEEFTASIETDIPCSVTAIIVFYDANGEIISSISQNQLELTDGDSFTLSGIAPQNCCTWKIFVLAEGTLTP